MHQKQLQQLRDLLDQEVDRKEFLSKTGKTMLAVLGVTAVLGNLTEGLSTDPGKIQSGYSASTYGEAPKPGLRL